MSKLDDYIRQGELYNFLLAQGDKWTKMQDIPNRLYLYPTFSTGKNFHNSSVRRLITRDIEEINSGDYEKIIISGTHGIKLATESEFRHFVVAEFCEIFVKLRRVRHIARKGGMDQQLNLEGEIRKAFMEG